MLDTGPGQGVRGGEPKGSVALTTTALSRAARFKPEPVSKALPSPEEAHRQVLVSLDDMKAEDTVSIDLRTKTAFADTMVVTSGRSHRHVGSIADRVLEDLRKAGCRHLKIEGMPNCDWVLIDAGDVIVHVFRPEVRDFYNLEKMWEPGSVGAKRRAAE
jgi:ribosome-associated protein